MSLESALELAKSKRTKINPNAGNLIINAGFVKQLKLFEEEISNIAQ
jgi:hypothetical protein